MIARVAVLEKLTSLFDGAVHESARADRVMRRRQRAFIGSHVVGALLAMMVVAVFLCVSGSPSPLASLTLAWFLTPLLIALYLSRTGRLGRAHFLSAANLIGLVVLVACVTGGVRSFVIVWMIIVPLEASVSGSRRIIIWSCLGTLAAFVGLYGLTVLDMLPPQIGTESGLAWLELCNHLAAIAYAGGLALHIEGIHDLAASSLREERERFRLLAENATDLISRHDAGGRVVFASPASVQLTGEQPDALLGDGLLERVLVADRPGFLSALQDAAQGEATDVEFRLRRRSPDGNGQPAYAWAEMRCRPSDQGAARDAALGVRGACEVVAVTRDISRRKRYEAELLDARAAADSANRAKSLFLANMSHELRTPLNAIIGFADILQVGLKQLPDNGRSTEHCGIIRDSGHQLLTLVNELLDISKIESGHYHLDIEPVDIEAIAATCRSTLTPQLAKKALRLDIDASSDLPDVEADARCIRQMLLNLMSNAIKFSPEGGVIVARFRTEAGRMVAEMIDHGIGISNGDIQRLGQPFVQACSGYGRHHEGTGLGLSVVKGMARLHAGAFEIESEIGKGTTVRITLPLKHVKPDAAVAPVMSSPAGGEGIAVAQTARRARAVASREEPMPARAKVLVSSR